VFAEFRGAPGCHFLDVVYFQRATHGELQVLAAALNRPLTYRLGGEVGAALGAARLARLCLGGERMEDVCVPPAIDRVVQPDAALAALLAVRRRTFVQLYQDLKNSFVESSA